MLKRFIFISCLLFLIVLALWSQDTQECYLAVAVENADIAGELPYFVPQDQLRLYIKKEENMEIHLFLFSPQKKLLYEYSSADQPDSSQEVLLPLAEDFWEQDRLPGDYELFLAISMEPMNKSMDLKPERLYSFLNSQYKDMISLSNLEELPYIVTGAIYNNHYSEDDLNLNLLEISEPRQDLTDLRNHSKMIVIRELYVNKFTVKY